MTIPLMQVDAVSLRVGQQVLVDAASLQIAAGELVAVVGPNGAGKSSLLRLLCAEQVPDEGAVVFGGVPLAQWPRAQLARSVAVLPQLSALAFPFSGAEVLAMGRIPHSSGRTADAEIIDEVVRLLDIGHLLERSFPLLSGGEKQRIQLGRVLVQIWRESDSDAPQGATPMRLLLLDEPNASQDLGHQQQVMAAVDHCRARGVAVLMVEHDLNLAAHYADRIVAMNHGRVVAAGAPAKVLDAALVRDLFGAEVAVNIDPIAQRPVISRYRENAL